MAASLPLEVKEQVANGRFPHPRHWACLQTPTVASWQGGREALTGMLCTDGAALEPSNPAVRRAGWA
eukprot:2315773-Prorocentrum_lima.AAC.1